MGCQDQSSFSGIIPVKPGWLVGMLCFQTDLNIIINDKKLFLHSITLTAKCSKKNERRQVNEKFHKLEIRYRDCIKRAKDKTRRITVYRMMHQALDDSDQTRKYGISESIVQALIMTLLQVLFHIL